MASSFPIPASLQDLEREPYNLLPYPNDFEDDDEAARADSFTALVGLVERGNRSLETGGSSLFSSVSQEDDIVENESWMDEDRIQALYTLVRKSTSLAPGTRSSLIQALCHTIKLLSTILDEEGSDAEQTEQEQPNPAATVVMSQSFRDAFACHLYMLFSVMFFMESEAKVGLGLKVTTVGGSNRRADNKEGDEIIAMRATCAQAMLVAAESMARNRKKLWKRGVPDESVVILPCRIAFQMLEGATGVIARRAASADAALGMIACSVDSGESLLGTIVAALMDLLHSYEHMATLCAELCSMVSQRQPNGVNRLAVELIREIGRLDTRGQASGDTGKASGIRFVAPFISELAALKPKLVLSNISHVLPHLNSEPYSLRSAIVVALGHIVEYISNTQQPSEALYPSSVTNEDGVEESETSRNNQLKTRGALLDILEARSHDVSSYTRSAVLKVWIGVTQGGALPLDRVIPVTALAIDRLQDKTVVVRKQAMQLLTALLENNPYLGDLDPKPYKEKLTELYEFVKAHLPTNIKEAHEAALEEMKENGEDGESLLELERATLAAAIAEVSSSPLDESSENSSNNELTAKVNALKFAQSALDFIDQFEGASAAFHGMLLSANSSDVTEALRFFVKARHFKLPCAITGIKQALSLMWSSEQSVKDEVLKAFVEVFIAVPGSEGAEPLPDDQIAYNLLMLAEEASVSELASIEEAIGLLVREAKIPSEVFSILWSAVSKGSGASRATALHVISMAASADRSIVDSKSRLKLLLDSALGDYTEERRDWMSARAAAMALQRIERAQVDLSCAKYLVLERIVERLCEVARGDWCSDTSDRDTLQWFSAAEQVIGAIFVICPEPEVACSEIIRGMHAQTLGCTEADECHPFRLARFFHVLGHIALKLLVYTEALSSGVRRANAKRTLKKQEDADKAKSRKKSNGGDVDDQIEAELGMAAEIEAENERKVAEIAEKEIVGRGLISVFGPLLVRVVGNESGRFESMVLLQTATLALCKFMCVSSAFCEKHLPVLFTALSNAPAHDTAMRANTVVALGDLAFRFPNEVEPYTPRLYACLRDDSIKVRRHTLMVLTHLILNDMVKVKGQVCEIAMCLRDVDQRIRDMSRLLFHELSKRSNNPVYNLLPDIISQLSTNAIAKDDFRGIMSFLLGYIKKDRQNEMLVDKLCQRFPKCTSISQQADIAYCMAQLKINEKSVKCLLDNFKLYKDALFDEEVKKSFLSILSKAKKFAKPELKQALDEWETKLNEHAELGMENQVAGEKAARARAKASKRAGRKKNRRLQAVQESDEDEDELDFGPGEDDGDKENEFEEPTLDSVPTKPRTTRTRRTRRQASNRSYVDEE